MSDLRWERFHLKGILTYIKDDCGSWPLKSRAVKAFRISEKASRINGKVWCHNLGDYEWIEKMVSLHLYV